MHVTCHLPILDLLRKPDVLEDIELLLPASLRFTVYKFQNETAMGLALTYNYLAIAHVFPPQPMEN
jgi:hypothetical protein